MNTYPSSSVAEWHIQKAEVLLTESANFVGIAEFTYYLDDFSGQACDNLVQVLPCEDPESGIDPIITVSSRIPEALRPYFALHEYIEFHIARLEPEDGTLLVPSSCRDIEEYVLKQFTDIDQSREYILRRIDMFTYIASNFGGLSSAMQETAWYLARHVES